MEKSLKLLCNILIIVFTLSLLASCTKRESDGSGYIFRYDLSANPRTLDPQTATDQNAMMVIENLFDGLLRLDTEGNIVAGVAKEYTVSDDGLTYTFTLRQDVFWRDKGDFTAQCTAHDFVYAFMRLFNPATKSQNAESYLNIHNAEQINKGNVSPEYVGVKAINNFTLTISLNQPDADFPRLLTATPARPCNEEFYIKSSGRYGLIAEAVPSNGAFYLTEWTYDPWWTNENRILLQRNSKNSGGWQVFPRALHFYMDRENPFKQFTDGNADGIIISGNRAEELISKNYPYTAAENSVAGIMFNMSGIFADESMRKTLAASIDRSIIDSDIPGYRKASAIVPDSVKLGNAFYRDMTGTITPEINTGGYNFIGSFVELPVIIVPDDDAILEFVIFITQQWQEKLSFFCRIEVLSAGEYTSKYLSGQYDMAAVILTASYNNPCAVLEILTEHNEQAASLIEQARFAATVTQSGQLYKQAELLLIENANIIPICFKTEYFFRNKKSHDLVYNPFTKTIIFREAKIF
ncbi:MAG: peptide ABC transporter substrate-binding protein [Oscillospiraceae bacterium]|nr:peptide ABC transporter substrate-binding protein [Oscillospiraceae bacterium]